MFSFFSKPVLIRHLWQLKTVVFLHWCLTRAALLGKISCQFLPTGGSMGPDVFCNIYPTKNSRIAINSTATEA